MKTHLAIAFGIAALSARAVAQDYITPDFTTGTANGAPTSFTVGTPFAASTSGGGTIAYSGNTMTVSDNDSATAGAGASAYITSTENVANSNVLNISLTFTPTYSDTDPTGNSPGQSNFTLFSLEPSTGSNNNSLSVTLQTLGYGVDNASILLNSGIAFGGSSTVGTTEYNSHGVDSLSGLTLTLNLQQVYVTNPNGVSSITTTGTLSDAANSDLYDFSYVTTESNVQTGYDPANNFGTGGLIFRAGDVGSGYDSGFDNAAESVTFSNISLSGPVVPEPSTYALMISGLVVLALIARRRIA